MSSSGGGRATQNHHLSGYVDYRRNLQYCFCSTRVLLLRSSTTVGRWMSHAYALYHTYYITPNTQRTTHNAQIPQTTYSTSLFSLSIVEGEDAMESSPGRIILKANAHRRNGGTVALYTRKINEP